jgi:hypothetical protein
MLNSIHRWLHDPIILVALVAGLAAFVVQSGELGSADTMHRLQTTHSWWTPQPEVFPDEFPEFGVHGVGGRLHSWYGMGQSLLMLPADLAGSSLEQLPAFEDYEGTDPAVRSIVVSYSTNILVTVLTALICLRFLQQLGFATGQAVAGVLALLFCTTHLHYTQNMMENNYIMLLMLTGLSFQYEWLRTGRRRALLLGSSAFGLNLLTRLTTGLDLLAGGVFLLLVLCFEHAGGKESWQRLVTYAKTAAPVYLVFVLIDRLYQHYRFGSYTNTYVSVFAQEYKRLNPNLPANYPWETPFHVGFLGALFKPEKSVFLFDPLLLLTILIGVLTWRILRADVKAYLITTLMLLFVYISFYARYTAWSGDFSWGDRYVSTAVELAAFVSVPLLLRHRAQFGRAVCVFGVSLIAVSAMIQAASLMFWLPLEIYQMVTFGHPTFVIALRFKNIVAFALGEREVWGLDTTAIHWDPWDYVHISTWNFLPFLLRRVGVAPRWVIDLAFAVWGAGLAAMAWTLVRLRRVVAMDGAHL